ncbi:MAG: site-specific DNA-methyltransferase, partial [Mariniphaga sp.]
ESENPNNPENSDVPENLLNLINPGSDICPNHILIEGDNLHALTALSFTHEGMIDVIYIDPPYNTGNKDFKYNDSYVDKEDSYRHSKWLSFMDKRLYLAKRLLNDKGVIFISIDDNEQGQLKMICDEVFGELNFTGQIIVETATDNNPSQISVEHEYLLCYSKNKSLQGKWIGVSEGAILIQNEYVRLKKLYLLNIDLIQKELRKWIKLNKENLDKVAHYAYVDNLGVYYPDNPSNTKLGGYEFEVLHPTSNKPCALPTNGFRFPETTFKEMLNNGNIEFGKDESVIPKPKRRLSNVKELLRSVFYEDGRVATGELISILGIKKFNNPKSIRLINYFLTFIPKTKSATILDFFAGSGTTLHATMQLNAEDGGNRQCILVTNNENKICEEVTYERNRRVIQGYTNSKGEWVQGLTNNNLRYYKSELVPSMRDEPNKRLLTQTSTDLLCIKEDCYTELTETAGFNPIQCRIFTNEGGKYLMIVFHSRKQLEVYEQLITYIKTIGKISEKIKLYAFSPEKETLLEDFAEVAESIDAVPLPEAIYNAYRATFRTLKLDKKPLQTTHDNEAGDEDES